MAYTTIDDPSAHFHTQLYTGNASTQSITNGANAGDFQPDWVWIKSRTHVSYHNIFDSSRGATKRIFSNDTGAEQTTTASLTSFDSDGFSLGNNNDVNANTESLVAWQWKANGGTTASNSDGSLASTVQANTTAGFSIVTWTADGGGAKTIGHGLSAVPKWIITKNRTDDINWQIYHASNTSAPETEVIYFTTGATQDYDGFMADTAPTSSVFTVGGDGSMNGTSGKNIVAYCFAEKQGYSKFGGYTGNGDTDGPFIYTGFKPAWLMIKGSDVAGYWVMFDNKRNTPNGTGKRLGAQATDAEYGSTNVDLLSNGFKVRAANADSDTNNSGSSYIYMAFAEHPFVSSEGVPVTAR